MGSSDKFTGTEQLKKVLITRKDADAIGQAALKAYPQEACGLLVGRLGEDCFEVRQVLAMTNTHSSRPNDRFEIAPEDLIFAHKKARAMGQQIIGHYHSHPNGQATPSDQDVACISDVTALWLIQACSTKTAGPLLGYAPQADARGFKRLEVLISHA